MVDSDLLSRCTKGDRVAQKKLFLLYSPTLYSVARRYAVSKEDAEDTLQEAWVNIFSKLHTYTEQGCFVPWMKKIVINKALRNRESKWVRVDMTIDDVSINHSTSPQILKDFELEEVNKLIDSLPDGYREIFKMRVIDELKHKDIANIMGIEESTSRAKMTIARRKLQKLINTINDSKLLRQ